MPITVATNKRFLLLCFLFSSIFFMGVFGKNISNSFISYISPIILLCTPFVSSNLYCPYKSIKQWSWLGVLSIIISYLLVGGGLGSVLCNINFILLVFLFCRCKFDSAQIEYFVKLIRWFTIYLLLYLFFNRYSDGYFGGLNANSIGMQGLLCFCFISISPHKNKAVQMAYMALTVMIVVLSNSRTSLGTLILFVASALLFRKSIPVENVRRISKICFVVIIVIGVLQTFIYSYYMSEWSLFGAVMEYSTENFDKSLMTGREIIWEYAWNKLLASPFNLILGVGSHFAGNEDFDGVGSNFHSSFFTVVICCGFLGYCILMRLYGFLVNGVTRDLRYTQLRYYLMPHTLMLLGFFESVLFSGNFAIQFLLFISFCHSLDNDSSLFFRK